MPPINFMTSEPFKIDYDSPNHGRIKRIGKTHIEAFWDGEASRFANKSGCYIFALRVSRGYTPWYVGKTKNSMCSECFTDHKLRKYNKVVFSKRGRPVLFFVTRSDNRTYIPTLLLNELELTLIQAAKRKNDEILNVRGEPHPIL